MPTVTLETMPVGFFDSPISDQTTTRARPMPGQEIVVMGRRYVVANLGSYDYLAISPLGSSRFYNVLTSTLVRVGFLVTVRGEHVDAIPG